MLGIGRLLAKQTRELKEQAAIIAEKDSALAEKDSALAEKDSTLTKQATALAEKDAIIAALQAQLEERKSFTMELLLNLEAIYLSISCTFDFSGISEGRHSRSKIQINPDFQRYNALQFQEVW